MNKFATPEDCISIDTMYDFKVIFSQVKQKKTQGRLQNWTKHHGEELGLKLWELEVALFEYLQNPVKADHFWSICNFPSIAEPEFHALSKIDPIAFIEGHKPEGNKYRELSNKNQRYLVDNMDFVMLLKDLFEMLKECENEGTA